MASSERTSIARRRIESMMPACDNDDWRAGVANALPSDALAPNPAIGDVMEIAEALDHAVAAHAKWKYRLMEAIDTGRSEWRVADVQADDRCDFGKWLAGVRLSQRLSHHFKQVRSLHAEFHALAAHVLELALGGRAQEATAAIAMGSRFAVVSSQLTMAVLAWKDAATAGPGAGA